MILRAALSKKDKEYIKSVEEEMERDGLYTKGYNKDEKFKYGSKKLGLDFQVFDYISYNWLKNRKNTIDSWNKVKNLKIPIELKKPNKSSIYRGFYLSETALRKYEQGKGIRLDPVWLSSWTEHISVAKKFAWNHGVVIEKPTSSLDIWICLEQLYPYLWGMDTYTQGMKEILVKGTGCPKNILTPDMVIWSIFTEKGRRKEMIKREKAEWAS